MAKRKAPNLKRMKRRLDDVLRVYIKLRDNNLCQTCGIHKDSTPEGSLDWSHYISRNYLIVRWCQKNSVAQCRKCHREYAKGFNTPMMEAINKKWGEGTTMELETMAREHPAIKHTLLNFVEFRMKLEKYYKKLIEFLDRGATSQQCMDEYKLDVFPSIPGEDKCQK